MARSFAAAIAAVDSPDFDLAVGYAVPPRRHAPIDPAARAAFDGFDYAHFRAIGQRLAAHYRVHQSDGEEAVQEGLFHLLKTAPHLYRESPVNWLGLLYAVARFQLLKIRGGPRRAASIDGLLESGGDAALAGASSCIPPEVDADDGYRSVAPPRSGEGWRPSQILGALQRFRDHWGYPPKAKHCRSLHGMPSVSAIARHFDGLAAALVAAGMVPMTSGRRGKPWAAVESAERCLSFRWRNGRWPDRQDAERSAGDLPSPGAMIRFFGGTKAAEVQLGAEAILGAHGSGRSGS